MSALEWDKEFQGAVTVCDAEGRIVGMNAASREVFAADGGEKLIGANVLDCHPEPSRSKLQRMMNEKRTNVYTIQKNGKKKLDLSGAMVQGRRLRRVRRAVLRDPLGPPPLQPG